MEWRLAQAKSKFSELIHRTLVEGLPPRYVVTDALIVLAEQDYKQH